MAHLATMMQGFHPFRPNDDGVPEDRGDQRLLPARARTRRIRSARSSRRGGRTASWRRNRGVRRWISAVGLRRVGVARRRLAGRCPKTCRAADNRVTVERDGRIRLEYRPNNIGAAPRAGEGDAAHPSAASASGRRVVAALAWRPATRRTSAGRSCFGTRSARVGARSVLPRRTTSRISSSWTRRSSPRRPP